MEQFYIENCHPAIISQEVFDRVQALLQRKKVRVSKPVKYPLSKKMVCGNCGATLYRNVSNCGTPTWICSRHMENTAACPTVPVMERAVYSAFVRMYNKLRLHEGIILKPALGQMEALETAVQRENPAMLEINRAIAQATEQNYKISKLRSSGLLDVDACAVKLAALDAQLTQLRAKRRRLLKNDDINEAVEALRQIVDTLRQGPDRLDDFDAELFADLVERVAVDSSHGLRFRLNGGFEVTEPLQEERR